MYKHALDVALILPMAPVFAKVNTAGNNGAKITKSS